MSGRLRDLHFKRRSFAKVKVVDSQTVFLVVRLCCLETFYVSLGK